MANFVAATQEPLQVVANKMKIGKAERRFAEGKWWLITPLTTIPADGILNGSKGPGFYPSLETQATVKAWDGMPLTAYHPMDEMGRHTSAGAPGVLDRQGIGIVRDSVWNGKLQHKGWFDEERTRAVNPLIYHNLIHRIPIETSTGLYTDNVEAPKGSNHNGRAYTWTAKNYRPDHIAVLPDQVGACSINDGCGVLVNVAGLPVTATQGLVTNQAVTLSHWVENESAAEDFLLANHCRFLSKWNVPSKRCDRLKVNQSSHCTCGGTCGQCKPSLNSLVGNMDLGELRDRLGRWTSSPKTLSGVSKENPSGNGIFLNHIERDEATNLAEQAMHLAPKAAARVLEAAGRLPGKIGQGAKVQNRKHYALYEAVNRLHAAIRHRHDNDGYPTDNSQPPSLNSLTINPFVSESQRRACYAADDPNWDCDEWNDKTKGKLPNKKPGVENSCGSVSILRLHTRPSLLAVMNFDPNEARGEGGKWAYTGAAGDRGKTLHKHSQAAHDAVTGLAADKELGVYAGKSLQERSWWDKLLGHYDARANSEKALEESSIGNHALASKYHLAVGTQLSQAANEVGREGFLHKVTRGWLGDGGDKEGENKLRDAASKHMYAGGEAGGSGSFGKANELTEEAHKAANTADVHKVAWLHHAAVNAHLKASQAWRDEADKQGDEGLKKVLGSIASEHQNQAWKHGKAASEAEVSGSSKASPKGGDPKKYGFLKPSTNQLGLKPSILEVENYNPFHDLKGKFAAAGGAVGAVTGAGIGRTYGTLKEKTWGRKAPIAYGASYAARGRNRGRDIGEAVGGTIGRATEGAAGTVAGLALKGWSNTKPVLSRTAQAIPGALAEELRVFGAVGKAGLKAGEWAGKKALTVPQAAVRISAATLLHGLAGGAAETGKTGRQLGKYVKDIPKPAIEALTKVGSVAADRAGKAYDKLVGTPAPYAPSVSPTSPNKAGEFGTGQFGKEYAGAIGSTSARGVHAFSLEAQNAATTRAINILVTGDKALRGINLTQEAYRDAQLGNHGAAADKHVKAAEVLQKTADNLRSWHLQAMQQAGPLTPQMVTKLSDRDKQSLLFEKAAHKNRLAAIMQGNNPATEQARHQSLAAFASERSAEKKSTAQGYVRASQIHTEAKEAWEKMIGSEHNLLYKKTYEELAGRHVKQASSYSAKALVSVSRD